MGLPVDIAGLAKYCHWKAVVYECTEKSGGRLAFRHKKPGEKPLEVVKELLKHLPENDSRFRATETGNPCNAIFSSS